MPIGRRAEFGPPMRTAIALEASHDGLRRIPEGSREGGSVAAPCGPAEIGRVIIHIHQRVDSLTCLNRDIYTAVFRDGNFAVSAPPTGRGPTGNGGGPPAKGGKCESTA
jgi:hypothetical protein